MQIGMSTASLFTKVPTEDTFLALKQLGVDLCEVFLSSFSEYHGSIADTIVKNRCINVHSIHALTNQYEPELFSKNPRALQDSLSILDEVLTMGERLGAKHYTFHGATMLKKIAYDHDYAKLSVFVNTIIDMCEKRKLTLNYETVHWAYFSHPSYFTNLKQFCPRLRATLDIKQCMQSHIDYRQYLDAVTGSLDTVHMCDYDADEKLYIPGRGTFDFVELFSRLADTGFDGAAIIEVYPQSYNNFDELKQALEYINECKEQAMALAK